MTPEEAHALPAGAVIRYESDEFGSLTQGKEYMIYNNSYFMDDDGNERLVHFARPQNFTLVSLPEPAPDHAALKTKLAAAEARIAELEALAKPEPRRFRVGDRVRMISGFMKGTVGTIIKDDHSHIPFLVKTDDESVAWKCANNIEHVTETEPPPPIVPHILEIHGDKWGRDNTGAWWRWTDDYGWISAALPTAEPAPEAKPEPEGEVWWMAWGRGGSVSRNLYATPGDSIAAWPSWQQVRVTPISPVLGEKP